MKRKITNQGVAGPASEAPHRRGSEQRSANEGKAFPIQSKKKQVTIDKPFILIYIIVYKCIARRFFACTSKELMMNKKTMPIRALISAKSQEIRSFIKAKKFSLV
ncbi:MAG: hypothetical protein IJ905_14825 [Fibrobacter sp.]|nr:hypothetical protein [Fibrobacter sp.]